MPAWVYIATAVWMCIEGLASVAMIGKRRWTKRPNEAIVDLLSFAWVAFLLIAAVAA